MRKLIDQNETSLEVQLKIILVTFDNDVHVLNDTPLPPEQILSSLHVAITNAAEERAWREYSRNWTIF